MNKIIVALLVGFFTASLGAGIAAAHSGGTDASGCHHDHKRGGYHCH